MMSNAIIDISTKDKNKYLLTLTRVDCTYFGWYNATIWNNLNFWLSLGQNIPNLVQNLPNRNLYITLQVSLIYVHNVEFYHLKSKVRKVWVWLPFSTVPFHLQNLAIYWFLKIISLIYVLLLENESTLSNIIFKKSYYYLMITKYIF